MLDNINPLSSPADQAKAREMVAEIKDSAFVTNREQWLAIYLARALAQIDALTKIADPMAARFGIAAGHKYPDLVAAGLGHLWQGPGFNDWHPDLLEGIRKHLKGMERLCHRGACCDYIRNRLHEGAAGFGALELRFGEGTHRQSLPGGEPTASPSQEGRSELPKTLAEMSPAEREAHVSAIHRARGTPDPSREGRPSHG